ncbi:MAG TPA: glycosyltransferase [Anaerolineales bacterium]|nr:glycosyltransferase [Anaerolineales bacterium]HLO28986.1 glycosyltransferase [Anaerolineales bacterium]
MNNAADNSFQFIFSNTIVILTPVYNDWHSFVHLLANIDACADTMGNVVISVIAVDDGSTHPPSIIKDKLAKYKHIQEVSVLHLARNLGHQKAIALGIAYVNSHMKCDVIIIDSDGEDKPTDIKELLTESRRFPDQVIFARRARRSEGVVFRIFYFLYRSLFRILTGGEIAFGNFSLIPAALLNRIAHLPEVWNHFAAGIMHANVPWTSIPTQRGSRYAGKSHMNFVALVIHGLSAISVYLEILTVRLMLVASFIIAFSLIGFLILLYIRYLTPLAIPGWATNVAIGIVVIMFQAILLLALLAFLVLNYRSSKLFIPAKDYEDYLLGLEKFL